MQFISYGTVPEPAGSAVAPAPATSSPPSLTPPPAEELVRPYPGFRPGAIEIDLPSGIRLSVDSYVNEKALARVLRAFRDVS